jgi:RNA polymerase sigma factor (TIGR02999 family)
MAQQDITILLKKINQGDKHILDEIYTQLYSEIKAIAMNQISKLNTGETITPTVMANECYIKLSKQNNIQLENKKHFLNYLAKSMRLLLIDIMRSKSSIKRKHITTNQNLSMIQGSTGINIDFIEIDLLLKKIERINKSYCEILEYKLIFNLTFKEISDVIKKSERQVMRIWAQATTLLLALSKENQ